MTESTYVTKINALLRKAESTGSQAEADALFGKAQELMTKWAIDDAMLDQARGKDEQEKIEQRVVILRSNFYDADAGILTSVAVNNQARVLVTERKGEKRGERYAYIVGFPTDLDRVEMLFTSMMIQMGSALEQHIRNLPEPLASDRYAKKQERKSFRIGFSSRIYTRLREARDTTAQTGTGNPYALALQSKEERVQNYLDEMGAGPKRRGKQKISSSGYVAGQRAADRADVGNPRVAGARRSLRG